MAKETKIIIGIVIVSVVGLIIAAFAMGNKNQPSAPVVVDEAVLNREDSQKIATDSATVTLVEFGDFQCPSCGAAHPIIKQLLSEYSTQVNFVFRNYPLPQHANAQKAAEAAEAAGAQGKYWEMYDLLFDRQADWSESKDAESIFVEYAASLEIDKNKLQADLDSNKYFDKVYRDKTDGNTLGVNSTPTFFINGELLVGVPTYEQFKARIDQALTQ